MRSPENTLSHLVVHFTTHLFPCLTPVEVIFFPEKTMGLTEYRTDVICGKNNGDGSNNPEMNIFLAYRG